MDEKIGAYYKKRIGSVLWLKGFYLKIIVIDLIVKPLLCKNIGLLSNLKIILAFFKT